MEDKDKVRIALRFTRLLKESYNDMNEDWYMGKDSIIGVLIMYEELLIGGEVKDVKSE